MELHHALRNLKDEMTKTEVSRNTLDILCERRTRARQDAGLQLLDDFNKDIDALITNLVNARTEVLNQELQVEACKSKVEKDRQVCLSAQKTLDCAQSELKICISGIGVCPVQVFRNLPKQPNAAQHSMTPVSANSACPHCQRCFIANAFVPFSCGCIYHPSCLREMILSGYINCPSCGSRAHGTWMATWGFNLDTPMQVQLEDDLAFESQSLQSNIVSMEGIEVT
jgi:hypothetical protein